MFFLIKICFFSFLFGIATSVVFSEKYFQEQEQYATAEFFKKLGLTQKVREREQFTAEFFKKLGLTPVREREQFTADEFFKKFGLNPNVRVLGGEGFTLGLLMPPIEAFPMNEATTPTPMLRNVTYKKTDFMSAAELAVHGNLSVGDIIESKILVKLENGTDLELPLVHKAVVIDPKTLQVIHYRYKDENDTTAEECRALEEIHNNTNNAGPTNVVANLVNTIEQQLRADFLKAKSIDDILKIRINCRGPIRNGLMDLMYKYDPRNRKVYQDNMVVSIVEPCRVNNEFDNRWAPLPAEEIVRRAKSRLGEEKFRLQDHNCETFANWARYGQNFTEQGQRIGRVIDESIQGFESLCDRANHDLMGILKSEYYSAKNEIIGSTVATSAIGIGATAVGCFFFAPICPVIVGATLVAGGTNVYRTFKEAASEALSRAEAQVKAKLAEYQPELLRIMKRMVVELKMEEIIKIDA